MLSSGTLFSFACGDEEEDPDANPPDGSSPDSGLPLQEPDAGELLADGGNDPYWTGYDSGTDIMPDAEPPVAPTYHWTDWTLTAPSIPKEADNGSAQGTIAVPGSDAGIMVSYAGQLWGGQTEADAGRNNYWQPNAPYQSAAVANGPPDSDLLMLAGGDGRRHALTFSQPVVDPVLTVVSFGNRGLTTAFRFDVDFDLLSHADGYFGNGDPLKHLPDQTLSGRESSGAIRFSGTFSKIEWTSLVGEPWMGMQVGIKSAAPTPTQ